ncbi:metallophosphoesterase [bacterium]|nr:metallophosphoesterase [bacterium]
MPTFDDEKELSADLVFVSDIHLIDKNDNRAQLLMALVKRCQVGQVKNFVLGGDICEFMWARSKYFKKKFAFMSEALSELASSGTNVYFVQGNHEYCMEEISWEGVNIFEAGGTSFDVESGGKTLSVGISHGDLLNAPKKYLQFKALLKSSWFKFFFTLIPSFLSDRFAINVSEQSRKKDKYRPLIHLPILNAAVERAEAEKEDVHLFGHFHFPYQAKTDSGKRVICVPAWDLPNAVVLKDGEFSRMNIKNGSTKSEKIDFKPMSFYQQ